MCQAVKPVIFKKSLFERNDVKYMNYCNLLIRRWIYVIIVRYITNINLFTKNITRNIQGDQFFFGQNNPIFATHVHSLDDVLMLLFKQKEHCSLKSIKRMKTVCLSSNPRLP